MRSLQHDGTKSWKEIYISTTQLREIGIPVIMSNNMIELYAKKNGDVINSEETSEHFGCVCF